MKNIMYILSIIACWSCSFSDVRSTNPIDHGFVDQQTFQSNAEKFGRALTPQDSEKYTQKIKNEIKNIEVLILDPKYIISRMIFPQGQEDNIQEQLIQALSDPTKAQELFTQLFDSQNAQCCLSNSLYGHYCLKKWGEFPPDYEGREIFNHDLKDQWKDTILNATHRMAEDDLMRQRLVLLIAAIKYKNATLCFGRSHMDSSCKDPNSNTFDVKFGPNAQGLDLPPHVTKKYEEYLNLHNKSARIQTNISSFDCRMSDKITETIIVKENGHLGIIQSKKLSFYQEMHTVMYHEFGHVVRMILGVSPSPNEQFKWTPEYSSLFIKSPEKQKFKKDLEGYWHLQDEITQFTGHALMHNLLLIDPLNDIALNTTYTTPGLGHVFRWSHDAHFAPRNLIKQYITTHYPPRYYEVFIKD